MIGDITLGATLTFPWPTSVDGVPTTVVGATLAAYVGASAVPLAGGLTWTPDVNGPGDNIITIVATSGNGYAAGQDVTIKLTAGTLGGIAVAPRAIAYLSVQHRSVAEVKADTAAVKLKTDKLTFNAGNEVASNVESINNTPLLGDGAGTPWGPV